MNQPAHIFIGSYSNNTKALSLYDFHTENQTAFKVNLQLLNPSFVLLHHNIIYLVEQHNNGNLYAINGSTYDVEAQLSTKGNDPCHISINSAENRLCVTNYSSGSFAVFGLENLKPKNIVSFVMHEGSSTNALRQQSPHPHCSLFTPENDLLFIADLGTDILYYYDLVEDGVICRPEKSIRMVGCGPRHLAHGKNDEKIIYLSGELDSTVRVLSYQGEKLQLLRAYRVSQNPSNFPSEIVYRQDVVYLACRGDNFLVLFDVKRPEEENQSLIEKFRFKVGEWPRHFKISPTGTIYVACQYQNIVQRFKWEGGKIFQLGTLKISCPSCIGFEA